MRVNALAPGTTDVQNQSTIDDSSNNSMLLAVDGVKRRRRGSGCR